LQCALFSGKGKKKKNLKDFSQGCLNKGKSRVQTYS
jgi:hypothetical protein